MLRANERTFLCMIAASLLTGSLAAQQSPVEAKHVDGSTIGSDGTAYVTRVVPVPATISPEAQKWLGRVVSDAAGPERTVEQDRAGTDKWQTGAGDEFKKLYPANVAAGTVAGTAAAVWI